MVRTLVAACFVLLLAIPALAQDEDYPKIQTSLGYANLGFFNFGTLDTTRHSGFANQTGFNLTKTWGLENYMGIYSLGGGVTLISDLFGGKATYRTSKFSPYALAGLGIGYFTQSTQFGTAATSKFATRFGGGVDIPISDSLSWKVEVSRMNFKLQTTPDSSWTSDTNIATGIVITLAQ